MDARHCEITETMSYTFMDTGHWEIMESISYTFMDTGHWEIMETISYTSMDIEHWDPCTLSLLATCCFLAQLLTLICTHCSVTKRPQTKPIKKPRPYATKYQLVDSTAVVGGVVSVGYGRPGQVVPGVKRARSVSVLMTMCEQYQPSPILISRGCCCIVCCYSSLCLASKHETLAQRWFTAGPTSKTVDQQ